MHERVLNHERSQTVDFKGIQLRERERESASERVKAERTLDEFEALNRVWTLHRKTRYLKFTSYHKRYRKHEAVSSSRIETRKYCTSRERESLERI